MSSRPDNAWSWLIKSPERPLRQYDKNCCRTPYHIGDAVWYLIKGTRRDNNKVRKLLPSYVGPYFVLGHLDDLVYRIQKGPKTKHARRWTPTEVSAPALDMDPADPTLGLSQLFTDTDAAAEEGSSCTSSDPEVDTVAAALSVPSTPPDSSAPEDIQAAAAGGRG
ncbi:hypothetical protein NQZ68_023546 [Dissostichus eleginoides]|nr:hypothetical protein NQZ68_023546 [Dissostichus eleginoides]